MTRINLWSSPRNVSTAFMYSFGQRADTTVVDEPLYAHYLLNANVVHPGQAEIIASQENSGEKVVKEVLLGDYNTPIAFFKQMTHHLTALNWDFMLKMKNILFIRNPKYILNSYSKVIENPTIEDIGVKKQLALFEFLKDNKADCVVLDSKELLTNPESVLQELCTQLAIPFDSKMLTWEKTKRVEDGVWAKYWYENVHNSTGFQPYQAKNVVLPRYLEALATECKPFYDKIRPYSIRASHKSS